MVKKKTTKKKVTVKKPKTKKEEACCKSKARSCCEGGGAIYGLGFIGAAIYYISVAAGFWAGVLGVLKALVWPVFLVHGLLKFLGL